MNLDVKICSYEWFHKFLSSINIVAFYSSEPFFLYGLQLRMTSYEIGLILAQR